MLNIISTKSETLLYDFLKRQKRLQKISSSTQDVNVEDSLVLAEEVSIFGDTSCYLIRVRTESQIEGIDEKMLRIFSSSLHTIFLVGSGVAFERKMDSLNQKLTKLEEKKVFDFPSDLVEALQKKDKKNSWGLLLRELNNKDAEPVHGTCLFAYKTLLNVLNNPKANDPESGVKDFSWKQAKSSGASRGRQEVVQTYFDLVVAYHKARSGEGDLARQLELWVLK